MASKSKTSATVTAQVLPPSSVAGGSGSSSVTPATLSGSQFTSLLTAIQESERRLDRKLADFKTDVRQAQDEAATKAVHRMRHDKPFEYRKKAHGEQARFNAQVEETVQEAQEALSTLEEAPALQRAQEALEKGARLLAERQKLIKIADRSANGWGVVTEYTADELADDSDDEKRLEKAEKAAERKAGLRKRKRLQPAPKQPGTPRSPATRWPNAYAYGAYSPLPQQPAGVGARRPGPPSGPPVHRAVGPCFACGEMGHLRTYCPKIQAQEKKWYPSHMLKHEAVPVNSVQDVCVMQCSCNVNVSDSGGNGEVSGDEQSTNSPTPVVTSVPSSFVTSVPNMVLEDAAEIGPEIVGMRWERESSGTDSVSDVVAVKGRLKDCISFWKDVIRPPASIISTIESGYVLPLKSEPTSYVHSNHQSASKNSSFVQESISELCATGCVVAVPAMPHICSPLSVVESSSGKKRLVINLRHLNRFLWKQKFKYEDLRVAMLLLERGDYMFSFDLKSGYHHVDIAKEHWQYLGFSWQTCFYVFTVLPFGLSSACYAFTELVRPLVRYWHERGLRIIVYLDDGLCAMDGESNALEASVMVRSTLSQAGFVANDKKSIWEPTQRLQWLGFVVDLSKGQIEVPAERVTALEFKLQEICKWKLIPAKRLASIVGSIISMSLAIGPVSRFMTRSMYTLLETRLFWWEMLEITPEARQELEFWKACLADYNCQPIWHSPSAVRVVYSDASDTGYGGYVVEHGSCVAYGQWSEHEALQSSTWRELTAVLRVLMAVAAKLMNFRVRWFTDNQNVARILLVGSKKPLLQAIALKVFSLSVQYQIRLEPEWIPRDL